MCLLYLILNSWWKSEEEKKTTKQLTIRTHYVGICNHCSRPNKKPVYLSFIHQNLFFFLKNNVCIRTNSIWKIDSVIVKPASRSIFNILLKEFEYKRCAVNVFLNFIQRNKKFYSLAEWVSALPYIDRKYVWLFE